MIDSIGMTTKGHKERKDKRNDAGLTQRRGSIGKWGDGVGRNSAGQNYSELLRTGQNHEWTLMDRIAELQEETHAKAAKGVKVCVGMVMKAGV